MSVPARDCRVGADATRCAVTEALRRHVDAWRARFGFDPVVERVLWRIFACRTPAMGVHACVGKACGWTGIANNPSGDRHCPQCQGRATAQWLAARQKQMLAVPHFQVVFTLPAELRPLNRLNQELMYGLHCRSSAGVLQDLAAQRMGATLGITVVLHTWTSELTYHPHVHCLVTAGGLSLDRRRWVPSRKEYLFPKRVMGAMFRGRFLDGLIDAFHPGTLLLPGAPATATRAFRDLVRKLSKRNKRWVVHVEPPNGRPVEHIAKYLARYVKRVAISDARIVDVTATHVTIRTKRGIRVLDGAEFVRRFTLHILPAASRRSVTTASTRRACRRNGSRRPGLSPTTRRRRATRRRRRARRPTPSPSRSRSARPVRRADRLGCGGSTSAHHHRPRSSAPRHCLLAMRGDPHDPDDPRGWGHHGAPRRIRALRPPDVLEIGATGHGASPSWRSASPPQRPRPGLRRPCAGTQDASPRQETLRQAPPPGRVPFNGRKDRPCGVVSLVGCPTTPALSACSQ